MINKQKVAAILFFVLGILFIPLFFLGANTVLDVFEKKQHDIFISRDCIYNSHAFVFILSH